MNQRELRYLLGRVDNLEKAVKAIEKKLAKKRVTKERVNKPKGKEHENSPH